LRDNALNSLSYSRCFGYGLQVPVVGVLFLIVSEDRRCLRTGLPCEAPSGSATNPWRNEVWHLSAAAKLYA